MFHIIPNNFFVPLSSQNRIVYWECISRLFAIMEHQLSFGVEREVLVDELEFYFGQENAAQLNIINLRLDITHLYYPAKNSFQKGRLKRREIFTELLLYTLTT